MKYWEVIADKLSAAGWSWGYRSAVTKDGWRWIAETLYGSLRRAVERVPGAGAGRVHSVEVRSNQGVPTVCLTW